MTQPATGALAELAAAMGVATTYADYRKRPVQVGAAAVRHALSAMGIEAGDDDAAARSLAALQRAQAQRQLPPSIVARRGEAIPVAAGGALRLETEEGTEHRLVADGGRLVLPDGVPNGYHRLVTSSGQASHLIVVPRACPLPLTEPSYGWMVQLYAARSRQSWGIGDYRDLATLVSWSTDAGADMVLVNPLHAPAPVLPQQNSPYSPTSRRYRSPLYLRVEDVEEFSQLGADDRARVAAWAEEARAAGGAERIDRDVAFTAKDRALTLLATVPRSAGRDAELRAWIEGEGQSLVDFATFCALAERHGTPWQDWPSELQRPDGAAVVRAREELADRVHFHMWLQWLCDQQLRTAQETAIAGGMAVGVIHDLAVGVDPGGADAWALQGDLAGGVTVGAPPDGFNQRGQNWALPPLLPNRLTETGYAVFRDMLRSVLRHAGGIRIDHIMGLWRLWWVPEGVSAAEGTYVHYPARDLLGVLALEADRAGAMVVGEDLGTVEEGVREAMAEHRVLSSKVLYFEHVDDDADQPLLPSAEYPRLALASVSTHDLPTAAGWVADAEIAVQTELHLFGDNTTPEAQAQRKAAERTAMLALLRAEGLVGADPSEDDVVTAMHAFLARTPALLVATGLGDAVGDRRQPNLPGTTDEYPNWRLPLARWVDGQPHTVWLEDLPSDRRIARVARLFSAR
jgi:4-alpha-glucanotransferase